MTNPLAAFLALLIGLSGVVVDEAKAGTCGSPVVAYFYHGVSVPQAPNGRASTFTQYDTGAAGCATGTGTVDTYVVPPGAGFIYGRLFASAPVSPIYSIFGLGINVRQASAAVVGGAQTPVTPLIPTEIRGAITVTFEGYGAQTYRTAV